MQSFSYKRTVQYTELVTVEAETDTQARQMVEDGAEGVRNNDDTVVDLVRVD